MTPIANSLSGKTDVATCAAQIISAVFADYTIGYGVICGFNGQRGVISLIHGMRLC